MDSVSKNVELESESSIRKPGLSSKFFKSDLTGIFFLLFSIPDMVEPSQSFNNKNTNIENLEYVKSKPIICDAISEFSKFKGHSKTLLFMHKSEVLSVSVI